MIYLVGENLDKSRAHYQAETGKIVQLMRGIYVDADADADADVLRYAVRIARYLYPRAYLSAASAILLAPTRDGRLFLSGPRNQRTRIRALEIIQNAAPDHPSVASATIEDGLGEFRTNVSSVRQRFLEAFRLRSEHAGSIDEAMRADIMERLVAEYGDAKAAADALWALARENSWYREGEQAERYLLSTPVEIDISNQAALDFIVAWHGTNIGHLLYDGFEWRWKPDDGFDLPLIQQRVPGKLPPFILSLLPEGWLERVLKESDERAVLRSGKRYMSNITISTKAADLKALPADVLVSRLQDFQTDGVFTGIYAGPSRGDIEQSFEERLARLYASADTPRLSGVQIKAPMFLGEDGALVPSTGVPFTHILKPAGTSGFQALPVIEFLAMALGRRAGLDAPQTALTEMPDGMPPALIVERFDIRCSSEDTRRLALEDLCSVLDLPPEAKYDGTIERIARGVRPLSTQAEIDLQLVLKRSLFAWLIADGDMHLKNLALLKVAQPDTRSFESVELAPLYDAVTTVVFPGLEHDRMALKINGKDNRLRRTDFLKMAATAGLTAKGANTAIDALVSGLRSGLDAITIPEISGIDRDIAGKAEQMLGICHQRLSEFE
ncbi:type II toxin-antitoxin system HipA family toxin [Phycobacter azelaicus]|uniref:type II toxin-antitoxin system HipA family toxin n=1 Tax=Phycobacter azelaicus TaxID=2668075 RepID=UPI001867D300|nr:type II toxin-antitoxin system HipA family toxin [Phycobacter azelaicus]MBE1294786.1 type II toxin-antitoxin system HipA family toxin [Paracoccaceae bacterium]